MDNSPTTSTSTPEIKKVLDWAFANREQDDRAREITERYRSGKFNYELKQAGMKPVEVPKKEYNLSPEQVNQIWETHQKNIPNDPRTAQMSRVPSAAQRLVSEVPGDIAQTFEGVTDELGDAIYGGFMEPWQKRRSGEWTRKTAALSAGGEAAKGVGRAGVELVSGLGRIFTTKEFADAAQRKIQDMTAGLTDEAARYTTEYLERMKEGGEREQRVLESLQNHLNRYQYDEQYKAKVDGALGLAEGFSEMGVFTKGVPATVHKTMEGFEFVKPGAQDFIAQTIKGLEKAGATAQEVTQKINESLPKPKAPKLTNVNQSEAMIANINRMNPSVRNEFYGTHGVAPETWLRERGIIGSRNSTLETLGNRFQTLRTNVDAALDEIPGTYNTKNKREDWLLQMARESSKYANDTLDDQASKLADYAQRAQGEGLTMSEINDLKRYFERNVKLGYQQDPTASSAEVARRTKIDNEVREFLIDTAAQNGFPELRQMNKEIQASKTIADGVANRMIGSGANNQLSLTDWIVLTPAVTADPGYIVGYLGKKAASSEVLRAQVAKALAGFPEVKPLPLADMRAIENKALQKAAKDAADQEAFRKQQEEFVSLQQAGLSAGVGDNPFVTSTPLSKAERDLLEAAASELDRQALVQEFLERRMNGEVYMYNDKGTGFVMREVDTLPEYGVQGMADQAPVDITPETPDGPPNVLPPSQKRNPPIEF